MTTAGVSVIDAVSGVTERAAVDGLRAVMLSGGHSGYGLSYDFAVLAIACVLMITIATRMYPRMTE